MPPLRPLSALDLHFCQARTGASAQQTSTRQSKRHFFKKVQKNFAVFRMFYLFFLLFCVLDDVSITVYDRDTLLNIGYSVAQRKLDFEFLNAGELFTDTASDPFVWVVKSRKRRRRRKRGKRAGVLVRLRRRAFRHPLPTIYWPTFSHWITNSVNCGRASHTNEKQGTAVLFASQKPGCLLWF